MHKSKALYLSLTALLIAVTGTMVGGPTARADVSFQTPIGVTGGISEDAIRPDLAVGPDHSVHLIFEAPTTNRVAHAVKTPGGSWSTPMPITNGDRPAIVVSPNGVVHVVAVLDGVVRHLQKPPGGTWSAEEDVSTGTGALTPDVGTATNRAIPGPKGEIHVVWSQAGEIHGRTRTAAGAWQSAVNISDDMPIVSGDPAVGADSTGKVYAAWAGSDEIVRRAEKEYKGGAESWSSPTVVHEPYAFDPDVAVGPNTATGPNTTDYVGWCIVVIGSEDPADNCQSTDGPISKTGKAKHGRLAGAILSSPGDGPHAVWEERPGGLSFGTCATGTSTEICYNDGPTDATKRPLTVSASPDAPSEYPAIASYNDGWVYVVWQEQVGGQWEIYFAESPGADADSDGMPDLYEEPRSCLDPSVHEGGPSDDEDGDELANIDEYKAGTDPCASDTDDDGCGDGEELGPNEVTGGRRNPLNHWDFADQFTGVPLAKDRGIVSNDISAVIARFGTLGDPNSDPNETPLDLNSYHASADRGGVILPSANAWDLYPADGGIVANDISAVIGQFGHICDGMP